MLKFLAVLVAISLQSFHVAANPILENGRPRGLPEDAYGFQKWNAGTTYAMDNDVLSPSGGDNDYTGGLAITFAGERAKRWPISLDPLVGWVEPLMFDNQSGYVLHSLQTSLIALTPDDITRSDVIQDDRPYSSLLYLANSRLRITGPDEPVDTTTFSVGILGLSLAKSIQRFIHKERDLSEVPEGWKNQISDGGELTGKISWARQSLLASNYQNNDLEYELKMNRELSVGYLTEATASLSMRWGLLNTPWWSFSPDRAEYLSQPAPVIGTAFRPDTQELYGWFGVKVRARAYNALLQGQFRESAHDFSYSDIEPLIGEAWAGVTWQFNAQTRLSYVLRYQTAELKEGTCRFNRSSQHCFHHFLRCSEVQHFPWSVIQLLGHILQYLYRVLSQAGLLRKVLPN